MRKTPEYCPDCGSLLLEISIEGRSRRFCEKCVVPVYENPLPATCVVAIDYSGNVLITKRAVEPGRGKWSLPGGFMEIDESPIECALRELCEETGLAGEVICHLGAEGQRSQKYINVMVAGFLVRAHGEPLAGDDVSEARWFPHDQVPELVFSSHRRIFERGIEAILTFEMNNNKFSG